jgi:hypothetical protein
MHLTFLYGPTKQYARPPDYLDSEFYLQTCGNSPESPSAYTVQHKYRHSNNADTYSCPKWNSNPRSKCSSRRKYFMPQTTGIFYEIRLNKGRDAREPFNPTTYFTATWNSARLWYIDSNEMTPGESVHIVTYWTKHTYSHMSTIWKFTKPLKHLLPDI